MTYSSNSNAIANTDANTDANTRSNASSGIVVLRSFITAIVLFMLGLFLFFATQQAEAQDKKPTALQLFNFFAKEPVKTVSPLVKIKINFSKTGRQTTCDTVEYRLNYSMNINDPAQFETPGFLDFATNTSFNLKDVLPAGLSATSVSVSGDVTDGAGGAPVATIGTTTNTNDTVTIANGRLSATDLDGDGSLTSRSFEIFINAKIDRAAFPAPAMVDNQATLTMNFPGAPVITMPSRDPSLPPPGGILTGQPTSIFIDLTDCDTPPPGGGGGGGGGTPESEPCFKVEKGIVDCAKDGSGAFIYQMPVGPEMAGRSIELVSLTPGVTITPASQIVPPGGGILTWTVNGAAPGMLVSLSVVGMELGAGPAEGWGLCCAQRIDFEIPADFECEPEDPRPGDDTRPRGEPDIEIKKRADVGTCTPEGGCNFTITARNVGDAPYTGKIAIDEITSPVGARLAGPPNAPWTCDSVTAPMTCTHPSRTLNPGESVELKVSFIPGPNWIWREFKNCAEYDHAASGLPVPFGSRENDRACASILLEYPPSEEKPPKKVDLKLEKRGEVSVCGLDNFCYFIISITNVGTEIYNGPLSFTDTYPIAAPISSVFGPTPPWLCNQNAPDTFSCQTTADIVLVPGAKTELFVTALVDPDKFPNGKVENCAELDAVAGETNLANQKQCVVLPVGASDGPDGGDDTKAELELDKTCEPSGSDGTTEEWKCRITVKNNGTSAPASDIVITDKLSPLPGIETPNMDTSGASNGDVTCENQTATQGLVCKIPGFVLQPGETKEFSVDVELSRDIPGHKFENCATGFLVPQSGEPGEFDTACAQGQITEDVIISCSAPLVDMGEGRCGCPEGTTYRNGKCGGTKAPLLPGKLPPVSDGLCKKLPGQYRTSDNRCLCRKGTKLNRSRTACVKIEPELCKLKRGQIRTQNGQCVCPRGTTFSKRRDRCVKEQCTLKPGQIRTQNGQCVCPRGTTFSKRRDRCVKEQCTLKRGQIRTQNGQCVCPRGTTFSKRRDRCVKEQCTLKRGQIRTQNGQCVCPRGTTFSKRRNRCVKEQCTLKRGQIRTQNGKCVCRNGTKLSRNGRRCVPIIVNCPKGYEGKRPNCRKICPQGTKRRGNRCITLKCPRGFEGRPPNCRKICRPGTVRKGNRCITLKCPRGFEGRPPNCRKICRPGTVRKGNRCITLKCPRGFEGRPPNCRKICRPGTVRKGNRCITLKCPRGFEGRPPNCRKICRPGTVRKGNRCITLKCPRGFQGRPPNCRKRGPRPCKQGYIRKNGRCVADLI